LAVTAADFGGNKNCSRWKKEKVIHKSGGTKLGNIKGKIKTRQTLSGTKTVNKSANPQVQHLPIPTKIFIKKIIRIQ
jgi:hypothetical protein